MEFLSKIKIDAGILDEGLLLFFIVKYIFVGRLQINFTVNRLQQHSLQTIAFHLQNTETVKERIIIKSAPSH